MIPYDPRSAFQESVVAQDSRAGACSTIVPAIQMLVRAIGLLAEPEQPIHKLGAGTSTSTERAEPQYDVTSRAAGYDLFLAYVHEDADAVKLIAHSLENMGLRVYFDREELIASAAFQIGERRALRQSSACAVIVGPSGSYPWRSENLRRLLVDRDGSTELGFIPVLLPRAGLPPSDVMPPFLEGVQWLRLNDLDAEGLQLLVEAVRTNAGHARATTQRADLGPPYKGLAAFKEADAPIFFGRDELTNRITQNLEHTRFLAVVGPSGSGKPASSWPASSQRCELAPFPAAITGTISSSDPAASRCARCLMQSPP